MIKKLLLLAVLVTLTGCAEQVDLPGTIYGQVVLVGTSDYSNIEIRMVGADKYVSANESGRFHIESVPVGYWPVTARKNGFYEKTQTVYVSSDATVTGVEFTLVKIRPPDLPQHLKDKYGIK